jgi:hypothetical protein
LAYNRKSAILGLLARHERIGDHENCVGADAGHAEKCIIQFALVPNLDDVKLEMQDGRRPSRLLHGDHRRLRESARA